MRFVLLLIAGVIAVVAAVAVLQMSGKNPQIPQIASAPAAQNSSNNVATVEVLVAREAVPVGTTLTEAMVDKQPWPAHLVLEGFITTESKEGANIVGHVARMPFQSREPFMRSKLANPNDPSFLAANLPAGMRAVALATDAISGVAGYVFPGDRVDILLTHSIPEALAARAGDKTMGTGRPSVTETLIPNVRVLAVNVRPAPGKEGQVPTTPSSITVEVGEVYAQQIKLAEKNGTLSLALRSLKDRDDRELVKPAMVADLTQVRVSIIRGASTDIAPRPGDEAAVAPVEGEAVPVATEDQSMKIITPPAEVPVDAPVMENQ
jgi:pilus assembly protein CpaB